MRVVHTIDRDHADLVGEVTLSVADIEGEDEFLSKRELFKKYTETSLVDELNINLFSYKEMYKSDSKKIREVDVKSEPEGKQDTLGILRDYIFIKDHSGKIVELSKKSKLVDSLSELAQRLSKSPPRVRPTTRSV